VSVPEGLAYSHIPCAHVLSVAGFLAFIALFPLGKVVYSEWKSLPDIPGFRALLTFLTLIIVEVRRCSVSDFHHIMRNQAARDRVCGSNEQCVRW